MAGVKGMRDKLLKSPARIEAWRAGVRVGLIRNRLQNHFLGKIELSPTQLKAAEILLGRTIPAMAHVEHTGEVNLRPFAVPLSDAEQDSRQERTNWEHRTIN